MNSPDKKENFAELLEKYGFDDFEQIKLDKEINNYKIIKNTKIPEPTNIQAEIDLHSQSRFEAVENALNFINHCRVNKLTKILIITGKGLGIVRQSVINLLDELKIDGKINRYKNAPQESGGQGALIVILN